MTIFKRVLNWLRRPKKTTIYHVRSIPVDYEKRRRCTTERLASEMGPEHVAKLREAGVI